MKVISGVVWCTREGNKTVIFSLNTADASVFSAQHRRGGGGGGGGQVKLQVGKQLQ